MPRPLVIGLMGGMSWESLAEYCRIINGAFRNRLGGLFGEVEAPQHADQWENAAALLADAARRLQRGGLDVLVPDAEDHSAPGRPGARPPCPGVRKDGDAVV